MVAEQIRGSPPFRRTTEPRSAPGSAINPSHRSLHIRKRHARPAGRNRMPPRNPPDRCHRKRKRSRPVDRAPAIGTAAPHAPTFDSRTQPARNKFIDRCGVFRSHRRRHRIDRTESCTGGPTQTDAWDDRSRSTALPSHAAKQLLNGRACARWSAGCKRLGIFCPRKDRAAQHRALTARRRHQRRSCQFVGQCTKQNVQQFCPSITPYRRQLCCRKRLCDPTESVDPSGERMCTVDPTNHPPLKSLQLPRLRTKSLGKRRIGGDSE